MEFQKRKLRLALSIIVGGLALALAWHGWMRWGRGLGYPESTFLFRPDLRFSDLTGYLGLIRTFDPYKGLMGYCNNMPASYLLFTPMAFLSRRTAIVLFLALGLLSLFLLLNHVLRNIVPQRIPRMFAAIGFLLSYPVLYAVDRGNNDLLLVPLVALSLLFYGRKQFAWSFLALLAPLCAKLYPVLLLLLFCRRRLIHWMLLGIPAFILVNWLALLTFRSPVAESYADLQMQLNSYNQKYNLGQFGIANSASAWNLFCICIWLIKAFRLWNFNAALSAEDIINAFYVYNVLFSLIFVWVTAHVLLVEKAFARRAMLLLIYLTVSIPGGGDYKLMYPGIALVMLILLKERRPADLFITAALALALIPKREVLLTFLGPSDGGYSDASLNIIINPLCLLLAMTLLTWDGRRSARSFQWRRSLAKLGHALHWKELLAFVSAQARPRPVRR